MASPSKEKRTTREALPRICSDEQLRPLVDAAPDAVVIVDAEGKITIVNRQTEELFGYSREELLGQPVEMLIPARHRARHLAHRTAYTESPQVRSMNMRPELQAVRKDGTEFPVEISLSPLEGPAGLRIFSAIRDVTRSKQIETELRQARSELEARVQARTAELARERDRARRYLDVAEVVLLALDRSGRVTLINRKGLRMLGYDETELIGRDWFATCLPKQCREEARQVFRKILDGELVEYVEFLSVTKAGEERLIAWHNTILQDPEGNVLGTLSSGEDITEQTRSQDALKKLAAIVESSDDAIFSKELDGTIVSWNAAAERLYGYSADEAIGHPMTMLAPPEGAKAVAETLERLKRGEHIHSVETVHVTKQGQRVNISLTASPVLDERGVPIAYASIAHDITKRMKLVQQLQQAHKMEAIGRLAGGVAHDFNNLLGVILGDSDLLLADLPANDPRRRAIEEIREAGQRAASLTRQLLAFSRQQTLKSHVLNLRAVLGGFENMLRRLAGPDVALELVLDPDLGAVRGDPNQLLQVVLNLVVNARDAMPWGGEVRIAASNVTLDEAYAASNPSVQPGRHVLISVADNGPGMNQETLARIFEPFFTTKRNGRSAGMGLAAVYGIVQQFRGAIWAYSEPGKGTTFKIYLPRADGSGPRTAKPKVSEGLPRGNETVLLVEDAGLLRRVTSEFLQRMGYTVLAAEDGPEALAIAAQHSGEIHLLLTDLSMPEMNGRELAERLKQVRPGLKLLFTSGFADPILAHQNPSASDVPFIEKPFTWQNLALKVRRILDQS